MADIVTLAAHSVHTLTLALQVAGPGTPAMKNTIFINYHIIYTDMKY
jgi:hypothetical protein